VEGVRSDHNHRAFRNLPSLQLHVARSGAHNGGRSGIEPHGFLKHLPAEDETVEMLCAEWSVSGQGGDFVKHLPLSGRMGGDEPKRPRQRVRRCLMPRRDEAHEIVADEFVIHAVAGFGISSLEEEVDEVATRRCILAASRDHRVNVPAKPCRG